MDSQRFYLLAGSLDVGDRPAARRSSGTGGSISRAEDIREMHGNVRTLLEIVQDRAHLNDARNQEFKTSLEALDRLVRGGGDAEGLINKVNLLIERNKTVEERLLKLEQCYNRLIWWIVGVLSTSVGTLLMTFVIAKIVTGNGK